MANSCTQLIEVLVDYNLMVSGATHLDGALLDHIYVLKSFCRKKIVDSIIRNIYFTDHDAVKLRIRSKFQNKIQYLDIN